MKDHKKFGITHSFGTQCPVCIAAHPRDHKEVKRTTRRVRLATFGENKGKDRR